MNKNYNNQNLNEEKSVLSETNLINIKEVKINHLKTPSLLKKQNKPFAKTSNKKVATKNIVKNKGFNQNKYLNKENRILKSKKDSLPKYSFSNKNYFLSNKNMIKNTRNYENNIMPSSYLLTATNNSFEENLKYSEGTNNSILTNFNRNKKHNPINLTLYSNNSKIYDYSNELYMNTTNDINFTKINAFQMTNHSTQKRNKRKIKIYDPLNTINNTKNKIKKKTKNNRNSYKMNIDKVKNKFNKTVIKSNDDKTFLSDKSLISIPQKNDKNNVKRDINLSSNAKMTILDGVFIIYLKEISKITNIDYFSFIIKFIVILREYINKSKESLVSKDIEGQPKAYYSQIYNAEIVPEICNNFFNSLPNNNYNLDKNELIEIVQHFCYWLYDNHYSLSHLVLLCN